MRGGGYRMTDNWYQQVQQAQEHCTHRVQIPLAKRDREPISLWLEENVGPRYQLWCHPVDGLYMFRDEKHAAHFALTWS